MYVYIHTYTCIYIYILIYIYIYTLNSASMSKSTPTSSNVAAYSLLEVRPRARSPSWLAIERRGSAAAQVFRITRCNERVNSNPELSCL